MGKVRIIFLSLSRILLDIDLHIIEMLNIYKKS